MQIELAMKFGVEDKYFLLLSRLIDENCFELKLIEIFCEIL